MMTTATMMMTTATMMTTTATNEEVATSLSAAAPLDLGIDFPDDPSLSELPMLLDPVWAWESYEQKYGKQDVYPNQVRVREFSHTPGRSAVVSFEVEWHSDDYLPSQLFTMRVERGKPVELFRYPDDSSLPGLIEAAHPDGALRLVNKHVLTIPARRIRVELVRYRPASRAVLRHSVGRARFYARVMRPSSATPLLAARDLIRSSGFVVPRLAGYWAEGAVMWMSEIPGKNLRQSIRRGKAPDPSLLLDSLQPLWHVPMGEAGQRPFDLAGAYSRARRSFGHKVKDNEAALHSLNEATRTLDPFVESWRPSCIAHNDFYDDQMLLLPDGRIALVDFEEAGPGDPMLDVGNFLAHLGWAFRFGPSHNSEAIGNYYEEFKLAVLERYQWNERDLALREAVCLFRVCTNAIRHPREDWRDRLEAGLSVVNETLG